MNPRRAFILIEPLTVIALTVAVLLLPPAPARADLLFVGDDWGTNLYEFDTVGGWSKAVFCGEIHGVNGLTTDGKGNIYESDFGSRTIQKFTPDGQHTVFAELDSSGGGLAFYHDGNLDVPYQWVGRIDKLNADGSLNSVIATNLGAPVQVAFDRSGQLFAADQKTGAVYRFDDDGGRTTFAAGLRANSLTFDRHGNLFVGGGDGIYKFAPGAARSLFSQKFRGASCLVFDSRGNLFVTAGRGDVYEFKNQGGTLATEPVRFARGLGHNYFITVMPGSMPLTTLLVKSFKAFRFLWASGLLLLLTAAIGVGIVLVRKRRRAPSA